MRSPTIEAYIPIGPELTHVLISIDGEKITWMNEKGLFHVCVDDIGNYGYSAIYVAVVPRKKM